VAALARNPGGMDFPPIDRRSPFSRHVFVGGNTLIPQILRDNASELGVRAPNAAFNATIRLAKQQLQEQTARLELTTSESSAGELEVSVTIENLTGHKFPTGHPARRAWLHVKIADESEEVLFESGAYDDAGVLLGAGGEPLASELAGGPLQKHRDRIDDSDRVYVLESAMADSQGNLTYSLLRGASYLKDNRLLPEGWRDDHPDIEWMQTVGTQDDASFQAGQDTVTYAVDAKEAAGPWNVEVELLYQPLSARYAAELFESDTDEVERFRRMYDSADRRPVVVGATSASVER
jgi:hypothetical protein